jgi:hypothetical protein
VTRSGITEHDVHASVTIYFLTLTCPIIPVLKLIKYRPGQPAELLLSCVEHIWPNENICTTFKETTRSQLAQRETNSTLPRDSRLQRTPYICFGEISNAIPFGLSCVAMHEVRSLYFIRKICPYADLCHGLIMYHQVASCLMSSCTSAHVFGAAMGSVVLRF